MKEVELGFYSFGVFNPFLCDLCLKMESISGNSRKAKELLAKISEEGIQERVFPSIINIIDKSASKASLLLKNQSNKVFRAFVHDFNNVLAAIIGRIGIVKMILKRKEQLSSISEHLEEIENVSSGSRDLILSANENILSLGQENLTVQEGIDRRLEQIVNMAISTSQSKKPDGLDKPYLNLSPITVKKCVSDLTRILMNVISNAYDAMAAKSYESGQNPSLKIFSTVTKESKPKLVIEVEDNGVGMSQAIVGKVFQEGFTTKGQNGGRGIGLHFVRRVVQRIGGEVFVESEPGKKTNFLIEIPLESIQ